ncbi:hypothetical protein ACGL13_05865, partial [Enterobacter hormaechei]
CVFLKLYNFKVFFRLKDTTLMSLHSNAKKDQTIYKKIQWIMSQNRKQAGGSRAKGYFEDSCGVTR